MARPLKNNADYFPHDNDLRNDRRCKALRNKYRIEGYGVFIMFLETLAQANHFEIEYNNLETELLAGDFDIDTAKLNEIAEYLLEVGLLEKNNGLISSPLHEPLKKLLTEHREKERKRKTSGKAIQTEVFHTENLQQIQHTGVLQAENSNQQIVFHPENTQSKVNESKEKEKKENIIQGNTAPNFNFCKDFFLKEAKNYYWEKKDDEQLTQLLQKLQTTGSTETLTSGFQTLIRKLPPYWRSKKFTIQHLNINFNEIINEIQAKKQSIQVHTPIIPPSYTHHTGSIQEANSHKIIELSEEQKQEARNNLINFVCNEYKNFCETGNFNVMPIRLAYNLFIEEKILQLSEEELKTYEVKALELRKQELRKPQNREEKFKFRNLLESYTKGIDTSEQSKIKRFKQQLAVLDFLKQCKEKNITLKNLFTENANNHE